MSLIRLNQLRLHPSGVYQLENQVQEDSAYSDANTVDNYLETTLQKIEDLSSTSESLQACIIDWPSEYHLSRERANLLRGFELSKVKRVLELGSGCGAISRYLGEQNIQVDAIEGSFKLASLGRLRCRDQKNVRVINVNYNDLKVPDQYYDLVVFVGVIECAHRFKPQALSDKDAALEILQEARRYLRQDGVVLVAIENRIGLKYILGAHEDHYSKRYVGINNYNDLAGIATYSETQWQHLIKDAGFKHYQTVYPFPDYKVPQVLLSKEYVLKNKYAFNHLLGIWSRDYITPHKKNIREIISWQAANQGGYFSAIANSFCFILGDDKRTVNDLVGFDFLHMSSKARMLQHASMTAKPKGEDVVIKSPIVQATQATDVNSSSFRQHLEKQTFYYGNVLQYDWLIAFVSDQGRGQFEVLVKNYYQFLLQRQRQKLPLMLDMIPINIIVEKDGGYQVFDQEWHGGLEISADYLLFRAALTFISREWPLLEEGLEWLELKTAYGFISHVFRLNKLSLPLYIDRFVTQEQQFQDLVSKPCDNVVTVDALLQKVFDFNQQDQIFYSRCSWSSVPPAEQQDPVFEDHNSISIKQELNDKGQCIIFDLPPYVNQLSAIRFDLFDMRKHHDIQRYQLSRLALYEVDGQTQYLRWHLDGGEVIARACSPESTTYVGQNEQACWIASSDFPKMVFVLGALSKTKSESLWRLEGDVNIEPSLNDQNISRDLIGKISHLNQDLNYMKKSSVDLFQSNKEMSKRINNQKVELNQLRLAYQQKHRLLHIIKRLITSFQVKIMGTSKNNSD